MWFHVIFLFSAIAQNAYALAEATGDCAETYFLSIKLPSKCESLHSMQMGAGIAAPSNSTSPLENPAGLIYNTTFKAHASYVVLGEENSAPTRTGAAAYYGTGVYGGSLSYQYYQNSATNYAQPGGRVLGVGLARAADFANAAAGLSFFKSVDPYKEFKTIKEGSDSPLNFGTIFNPKGNIRLGVSVYDLLLGGRAGGFGLAKNFGAKGAAALDAIGSLKKQSGLLKFSYATSIGRAQLSAGYGFKVGEDNVINFVRNGFSLGAALWITDKIKLMGNMNQIDHLYVGATVNF